MLKSFRLSRFKKEVKSWVLDNVKSFPTNWLTMLDDDKLDTFF